MWWVVHVEHARALRIAYEGTILLQKWRRWDNIKIDLTN
jgi:hypothetical protein